MIATAQPEARLTLLQSLSASLARSDSAEEVGQAVAKTAAESLSCSCTVYVLDPPLRALASVPPISLSGRTGAEPSQPAPKDLCAVNGEAVWTQGPALTSGCVPLKMGERLLGVLAFDAPVGRSFTEEDRAFSRAVADATAVALDRLRLLDRLQESTGQSEEAHRIKDEFLGIVNHELRTPLNAILGWTQLISGKLNDPGTLARGLEVISRNAQLQTRLVENMLDMSLVMSGRMKVDRRPIDFSHVVAQALEVVRPLAVAKSIDLRVRSLVPERRVEGDAERLKQVVSNILANAVRFTPDNGWVEVALDAGESSLELVVSDSGVGIEPEVLARIFNPFQQGDSSPTRRFGGLGLGLALARHLAQLHGGALTAESAGLGKGSTFRLTLPALHFH